MLLTSCKQGASYSYGSQSKPTPAPISTPTVTPSPSPTPKPECTDIEVVIRNDNDDHNEKHGKAEHTRDSEGHHIYRVIFDDGEVRVYPNTDLELVGEDR